MFIDVLQNKIRELKNPVALWLAPTPEVIPLMVPGKTEGTAGACGLYAQELLEAPRETVGAARVSFLTPLPFWVRKVLKKASDLEYYVILDWMHTEDAAMAERSAPMILKEGRRTRTISLPPKTGRAG